jgi:lipopolysaccharide export LptBFGC system permease protein LptF
MGVLFSIITVFLYYNLWVISAQILARKGLIPPVVGVWMPNVLFVVAALVALWKSE